MLKTLLNTKKNWFKVRDVEYSTNLRFFREHQIASVSTLQGKVKYFSLLEAKPFKEMTVTDRDFLGHDTITEMIHKDLLNGKFGYGEYTN